MSEHQSQVGTRKYMSPELLESAISFEIETFLRCDVYACALVLWELLTRTKLDIEGYTVGDYMMPFEQELGKNPSQETMIEFVVQKQVRPKFRPEWSGYSYLSISEPADNLTFLVNSHNFRPDNYILIYRQVFL